MTILTNYCQENSTEDKQTTASYIYEIPDAPNLKKAIRINQADKLVVDITIVNYKQDLEENSDDEGTLYLKFNLIKGYGLQMYDIIEQLKIKLKDEELIY